MTKTALRWWLWVMVTVAILITAGIFGFYGALWRQDVTFIGLSIIGAYLVCTVWIAVKKDEDYSALLYIADLMERAGILASFIGLCIAFQALQHSGDGDGWKQELLTGVSTKFLASITGLTGAMFLRTQVRLLGHAE